MPLAYLALVPAIANLASLDDRHTVNANAVSHIVRYGYRAPHPFREAHFTDPLLAKLVRGHQRATQAALVAAITAWAASIDDQRLEAACASRDIPTILAALPTDQLGMILQAKLIAALQPMAERTQRAAEDETDTPHDGGNDAETTNATRREAHRHTLLIVAATLAALRELVELSLTIHAGPRQMARQLKGWLGMTPEQTHGLTTLVNGLVGKGLAYERAALAYVQRAVLTRARALANTALVALINRVRTIVHRNAGRQTKTWQVDGHPCKLCRDMDGETVPIDESFSNGLDGPPYHVNCCCSLDYSGASTGVAF